MFPDARDLILAAPVIFLSLTVHEYCHARVAWHFGDDTASRMGRLTLNPFAHLDLVGTICLFVAGFGWARPVPVNSANFREPRKADLLVSAAGPLSNLVLALLSGAAVYVLARHVRPDMLPGQWWPILWSMARFGVVCNVGLFLFNLLPLFPLDGSHVVQNLLPYPASGRFRDWGLRYGGVALLLLVLTDAMGVLPVLDWILRVPRNFLVAKILGISPVDWT